MMKAVESTPPSKRNYLQPDAAEREDALSVERPVVLLVDDFADNLLALEAMLRCDAFEIATAQSGRAALDILLARNVALAIIDVHMPEMDGFELATLMRGVERTRYVPIVFVTADSRETSRMFKGYEVGAVDYLWKPVDEQVLRSKVDVFVTLERQRQQLVQAERMREMFVGILGHDLRNPLQGILMAARLAANGAQDDERRRLLELIRQSGGRMTRMITQILDLTRIRVGGGLAIHPTAADFRSVVEQIVAEFPEHARLLQVDCLGDTRGAWDADRLLQLVSNLVGNAVEHSPAGAPIGVRIDGRDDGWLALEVRNGGRAISRALRDALFEPFRSGDRTRGLGLGLFICKQIVEAHGGVIDCDSSDEAGTCFRVSLPRFGARERQVAAPPGVLGPIAAQARRRREPPLGATAMDGDGSVVILLVDDDPGVCESLELILAIEGYRVVTAADGDEAAARISRDRIRPDVIVSDYQLSQGATGPQIIMRLREMLNHDTPAVVLAGAESQSVGDRAGLQNSVQIGKSADFADLTQVIRTILSMSSA